MQIGLQLYEGYQIAEGTAEVIAEVRYENQNGPQEGQQPEEGLGAVVGAGAGAVRGALNAPVAVDITLECPQTEGREMGARRVTDGDSLWSLWRARQNKAITWQNMLDGNEFLEDANKIYPGEYVCVDRCISAEADED